MWAFFIVGSDCGCFTIIFFNTIEITQNHANYFDFIRRDLILFGCMKGWENPGDGKGIKFTNRFRFIPFSKIHLFILNFSATSLEIQKATPIEKAAS